MKGVLVETDLIVAFLNAQPGAVPTLRRMLAATTCYTTFIQAAEIYGTARTPEELRAVERAVFGLKVLGASSRYAATIGRLRSSNTAPRDLRTAIVAAMAIESRMPIVTGRYADAYADITGLHVITAARLAEADDDVTFAEILTS